MSDYMPRLKRVRKNDVVRLTENARIEWRVTDIAESGEYVLRRVTDSSKTKLHKGDVYPPLNHFMNEVRSGETVNTPEGVITVLGRSNVGTSVRRPNGEVVIYGDDIGVIFPYPNSRWKEEGLCE